MNVKDWSWFWHTDSIFLVINYKDGKRETITLPATFEQILSLTRGGLYAASDHLQREHLKLNMLKEELQHQRRMSNIRPRKNNH